MTELSPLSPSVRLDIWLWAARFFKTRSLAKQAIETGKVSVAGQRPKSSRAVRVGEQLQVDRGEEHFEIQVLGLSDQRGPAPRRSSCMPRVRPPRHAVPNSARCASRRAMVSSRRSTSRTSARGG